VGIRVARALGRPIVGGIKGIDIEEAAVVARRETDAGFEVYRLPLPAVVAVKEGINLPRYPTLPSRLKAKKAEIAVVEPSPAPGGLRMLRLANPPEVATSTTILGHGPDAAPAVADLLEELSLL
jgi:electron transfer flavoprotein beta subunit